MIKTKPIRAEDCDPRQIGEEIPRMLAAKETIAATREEKIHSTTEFAVCDCGSRVIHVQGDDSNLFQMTLELVWWQIEVLE
mmetsp:Transcript_13201/g.14571  ORF Transcript_13201/g.14571 Transcript_13201/m.14571 type:complete len:81 (-) Transcript_13201:240-482(-)